MIDCQSAFWHTIMACAKSYARPVYGRVGLSRATAVACDHTMGVTKSFAQCHAPARERAGWPNEGRLRGLLEPAQAGLVWVARPYTGRAA